MKRFSLVKAILWLCVFLCLSLGQSSFAQSVNFPNADRAFVDWADVDPDGDPDLLYSYQQGNNQGITRILLNNNGQFSFAPDTLNQSFGYVRWGDIDNDGDLDFAQLGSQPGIYRNNGNLDFSPLPTQLPPYVGKLDWGDYDNDGDLDLVIAGALTSNWYDTAYVRLFRNDAGVFGEVQGFMPIADPLFDIKDVHWVDYDVDGDLDLSISNGGYSGLPSREGVFILDNDEGNFSDLGITLKGNNAAWGDMDADGDPDVNCGRSLHSALNSISFSQSGVGVFMDSIEVSLAGLAQTGLSKLGDWDNDGDLDWIIGGGLDATPVNGQLLINQGNGFALDSVLASFKSPASGGFADVDGDGDLDFLMSGVDGFTGAETFATLLYLNDSAAMNTPPSVPTGLTATISAGGCNTSRVTFQWNPAIDNETASAGLTYTLRVGTTSGGHEIFSGAGHWQPVPGNVQGNTSWSIENLDLSQDLYWSVEAVDNSYAGSGFAVEQVLSPPPPSTLYSDVGISFPGIGVGTLEWGDFDSDGDLDVLASGNTQVIGTGSTQLYRNDGNTFNLVNLLPFLGLTESSAKFIDFDLDNDLDVILMGANTSNDPIMVLYQNTNAGSYVPVLSSNFVGLSQGGLAVGDYNDDRYPDVVATGLNANGIPQTIIYTNFGGNLVPAEYLLGLYDGDIAWHDRWDRFSDLVLSGTDENGQAQTYYYRNDGDGFSRIGYLGTPIFPVSNSSIAANNRDGDGFYEYAFMGSTSNGPFAFTYVYDDQTEQIPGFEQGDIVWIDYDSDGDNDLVLTGIDGQSTQVQTHLYENVNDTYSWVCGALPEEGNEQSRLAVADYDNDGDLDLMFTSFDMNGQAFGRLYRNDVNIVNSPPSMPANITLFDNCSTLELRWDEATDNESPPHALTYAVQVGTSPGGSEVLPSQALPNGTRFLTGEGNIGNHRSVNIPIPDNGRYYIGLQTIDNGHSASDFWVDSIDIVILPDTQYLTSKVILPDSIITPWRTEWMDIDGNGYVDLYLTDLTLGDDSSIYKTSVLYNDGTHLSPEVIKVHTSEYDGTGWTDNRVLFGIDDYNGDGKVDLIYQSFFQLGGVAMQDTLFLHANLGNNEFSHESLMWIFPDSLFSHFSDNPIDYNHDGNKDFIVMDRFPTYKRKKLLYYDETGNLYKEVLLDSTDGTNLFGDGYLGSEPVYDLNSDGYPDLLVAVSDLPEDTVGLHDYRMRVYLNDQQGGFTVHDDVVLIDTSLHHIYVNFLPGDLDNDGDQDLAAILFFQGTLVREFRLFRNEGNLTFTPFGIASLVDPQLRFSAKHSLKDFDNDGDLDIVAAEYLGDIHLLENTGNFVFHDRIICSEIQPGAVKVIDMDGDLDLDAVGSPYTASIYDDTIYQIAYQAPIPNMPPTAPGNLTASYRPADSVLSFSWNPSTDDKTPSPGLSYNLYIGNSSGIGDIIHPLSIIDPGNPLHGKRMIYNTGNALQQTSWNFHDIEIGKDYYWSVQAIDHSMAGSPFGIEHIAASNRSNGNGTVNGTMGTGNPGGRRGYAQKSDLEEPIPDAWIALIDDVSKDTLLVDKTDSLGVFNFRGIMPGDYHLVAKYNDLPMQANNPVLSFFQSNTVFDVTVLAGEDSIWVLLDSTYTTHIEEPSEIPLSIYPNPATDVVMLSWEGQQSQEAEIELRNMLGQTLKKVSWDGRKSAVIDLVAFPSGLYMVHVFTSNGSWSQKLIKD